MGNSEKKTIKEVARKVILDLHDLRQNLDKVLNRFGVETGGLNYREVIEAVSLVKAFEKGKTYVGLVFDSNGYIIRKYKLNDFYEDSLPEDIDKGYYKMVNGKPELDYEKKRILEEM